MKSVPDGDESKLPDELATHAGFLIRRAQQLSVANFNARFGGYGLTPTQAICLHAIRRQPGIDQLAVARAIAIDHATAAMVIGTLEGAGYVKRGTDPNDRRRRVLTLTRKGSAALRRLGAFADSGSQLLSVLEPHDAGALVDLLARFVRGHENIQESKNELKRRGPKLA